MPTSVPPPSTILTEFKTPDGRVFPTRAKANAWINREVRLEAAKGKLETFLASRGPKLESCSAYTLLQLVVAEPQAFQPVFEVALGKRKRRSKAQVLADRAAKLKEKGEA